MAPMIKSLVGQQFSRLLVLDFAGRKKSGKGAVTTWRCLCMCGNETIVESGNLKRGSTKSCGCLNDYVRRTIRATHNDARSKEYRIWLGMKHRCHCKSASNYNLYGGRGIKVCGRWRSSYENFLSDVGRSPSSSHSLDRIDNNRGYEPGNVKWATPKEQCRNTRANRIVMVSGIKMVFSQACEKYNINWSTADHRIRRGWTIEETFNRPVRGHC